MIALGAEIGLLCSLCDEEEEEEGEFGKVMCVASMGAMSLCMSSLRGGL